MMKFVSAVFIIGLVCVYAEKSGIVKLTPKEADGPTGILTLTQTDKGVEIKGNITNLKEGKHGFHIHEKGDLSNGCDSTGGHFNPHKKTHGAPEDDERHVGDLGNIIADNTNTAQVHIIDKQICLEGDLSIIGRAIVVHSGEDDLGKGNETDSKTTGHAGSRLACGIIGILNASPSTIISPVILVSATLLACLHQYFI